MKKILLFFVILLISAVSYADYSRIVSLAPAITSSLCELNAEDKLVGVTLYCKLTGREVVGTMLDINVERIVSLKPDLVLAAEEWNSLVTIEKLKSLGLNVVSFKNPDSFEKTCDNFIQLSKLVGKEKEASVIVAAAKKDVSTIYERAKKLAPKKVFWQIDTVPLVTINNSTFTADLIKFSGGVNIFYDLKAAYSRISREEVIKRNPDIIIIAALGKPAVDEKTFWLKFREMNAVKNNRVFIVDPYEVCQPTPAKFLESLKIAANLINPGIVNNE